MAFSASQMEAAWETTVNTASDDMEFVDVIQSTTGEYYRLTLAGGTLYHWNRSTGAWVSTGTVPINLIAVAVRGSL